MARPSHYLGRRNGLRPGGLTLSPRDEIVRLYGPSDGMAEIESFLSGTISRAADWGESQSLVGAAEGLATFLATREEGIPSEAAFGGRFLPFFRNTMLF